MRFAYIDSNGNEVPIPSVDALALRIELGAITDETQLYDAQADQWGPATSHEIYHTLVRDTGEEEGFIAPPPVAPPPVASEAVPEVVPDGVVAGEEALSMEEIAPDEGAADSDEPVDQAEGTAPEPTEELELAPADDFGVGDLAPAAGFEPSGQPAPPTAATGDGGNNTLELAPQLDAPEPTDETKPIDLEAPPTESEDVDIADTGAFSFGAMEGGLELDTGFDTPDDAMDFSGGGQDSPMDLAGQTGGFVADEDDPVPDFSGGMELESTMEFDAGGFSGGGGSLDLETPMSEFTPDDPPSWMEDDESDQAAVGGDVMDFSSVSSDPAIAREQAPKRTSKSKPSRPRRPRRSMVGPLVGIVVLVAIGAGGYAAWPAVQEWMESRGEPEVTGPVLPPLDADLVEPMRDRANQAFAAILTEVRSERVVEGAPAAPPSDWLAGIYLAQASDYEGAALFWDQMSEVLAGLRAVDLDDFDAAFAATGEAGVDPADFAAMRARADSGFVAATAARNAVLDDAQALIDGASRLHQFLVANEANIEYAPASVVTTDPVLEVNPATDEIRTAMQDLIGEVVDGLAGIDYRDRPTADGLWATILARWQAAGIQ